MARTKNVDGQRLPLTAAEETARDAEESQAATEKVAYDANAYARTRADAYPSIGDQLDMLWHAVDTGDWTAAKVKTTEFYTALKAVKDANPKP